MPQRHRKDKFSVAIEHVRVRGYCRSEQKTDCFTLCARTVWEFDVDWC